MNKFWLSVLLRVVEFYVLAAFSFSSALICNSIDERYAPLGGLLGVVLGLILLWLIRIAAKRRGWRFIEIVYAEETAETPKLDIFGSVAFLIGGVIAGILFIITGLPLVFRLFGPY